MAQSKGLTKVIIDVDMLDSHSVSVIGKVYGALGELAVIKILMSIYRNGYYIAWNDETKRQLSAELHGCTIKQLSDIVSALVTLGYFSAHYYDQGVLTSQEIQDTYIATCAKFRRAPVMERYIIGQENVIAPVILPKAEPKTEPIKQTETQTESLPRPITETKPTLDDAINRLLSDTQWSEAVCMRYHIEPTDYSNIIKEFRLHSITYESPPSSIGDFKRHFCNWYRKAHDIKRASSTHKTKSPPTDDDYTNAVGFGSVDI